MKQKLVWTDSLLANQRSSTRKQFCFIHYVLLASFDFTVHPWWFKHRRTKQKERLNEVSHDFSSLVRQLVRKFVEHCRETRRSDCATWLRKCKADLSYLRWSLLLVEGNIILDGTADPSVAPPSLETELRKRCSRAAVSELSTRRSRFPPRGLMV